MLAMLIYFTMLMYYFNRRKEHKIRNWKVASRYKGRIMISSKCAVCDSKTSKFIRKKEAEGPLSIIGKTPILALLLI